MTGSASRRQLMTRFAADLLVYTSVLHGPGLGPRAGPARSLWAGPGQVSVIVSGPGRAGCGPDTCRPGPTRPGLVSNNCAGCGPGLGLTFPGLGRARAYSESHSYFNIMVKITFIYPLQ